MPRLTISFKGTEDDEELYEALRIVSHGNFSAYAKSMFRDILDISAILEAHAAKTNSTRPTSKIVGSNKVQINTKETFESRVSPSQNLQLIEEDIDEDLDELPDLPDKNVDTPKEPSAPRNVGSDNTNKGMIGGMDIGMVTKMNFSK